MAENDDNYMGRGKAQVLFNHLPQSTFDYDRGFGIHRVKQIRGEAADELDRQYIAEQVIRRVRQWNQEENSLGTTGFPEFADSYTLLKPTKVKTEFFPLLLTCNECGRAHFYQSPNQLAYKNREMECDESDCDGFLSQEQFVGFHECGSIESLAPSRQSQPQYKPGSCSCGETRWRLDTKGSQRLQNFRWVCMNCGNREELSQKCGSNCDLENTFLSLNVHRGSNVYQPHYFNLVSVSSTGSNRLGSVNEAIAVLAKYLGLSDESVSRIDIEQSKRDSEREELEEMRDNLQAKGLDSAVADIEEELANLDSDGVSIRESVENFVPELTAGLRSESPDEYAYATDAVQEIYEHLNISNELRTRPAADIIMDRGEVDLRKRESLEDQVAEVERKLDQFGIDDAGLIEDFPITSVVFGFSRGGRDPSEARLISFGADDAELVDGNIDSSTTPVFVDTVRTEAVRFKLRPRVVMAWLLENSRQATNLGTTLHEQILSSSIPRSRAVPIREQWTDEYVDEWSKSSEESIKTEPLDDWSTEEIHGWLAENMTPIPEYDTISLDDPADIISYYIYHLVHSFSHIVLKFATSLIGMERTSISEYLLPRSLTFIVYSNQRTDFNLGGMHALVESGLDDLIENIDQEGNNCVYDPVCSRDGSTCFNCMFVSEVSCSHLNRNLGRDFLFGSKSMADRELIGYWELAKELAHEGEME
ncbi:hypothetical protein ACNO8S_13620 [Haloarcula sp. KBTZ06]|uniref:hypothetical protein n=1 Tax=Haloarcula sp. KBTZ06 TaxID=3402682 RepID=UPI003B42E4FC